MPEIKKITSGLLKYCLSRDCHSLVCSGMVAKVAAEVTMTVSGSPVKCEVHCAIHVP